MGSSGGFRLGTTFNDLLLDEDANETAAEFLRDKIRERVNDPEIAELLSPRDHPFFTKRPPLENGYYETFNRENVTLVDVRTGADRGDHARPGCAPTDGEYEVDSIVYATGFDAMTGTLFKLGIRGRDGLAPAARSGPTGRAATSGIATHGFPNLFMITGPQSPSVLSNMPVSIEQHVDWIADCLRHLREQGLDTIEATPEAEDDWVAPPRRGHRDDAAARGRTPGGSARTSPASRAASTRTSAGSGPTGRSATRSRRRATTGSS